MATITSECQLLDSEEDIPGHNIFDIDGLIFSSYFDNGNLLKVEKVRPNEYKIWTAPDNFGKTYQARGNNAWFHFSINGLISQNTLKINLMTSAHHTGLYKQDMVRFTLIFR